MRLLVFGHWSDTGFGTVTRELCTRLVKRGVDLRIVAVNHRGEPLDHELAPRIWKADMYGHSHGGNWSAAAIDGTFWDQWEPSHRNWKPDAVLVIADVSGLMSHIGDNRMIPTAWTSVPVFHYCPIEGDRLPVSWKATWQSIRPVAMSLYGASQIADLLGRSVPMIYHGVDTTRFRPITASEPLEFNGKVLRSKEDCKRLFGLDPQRLAVLRTDRNVVRKFYDRMMAAAPELLTTVPDVDIVLHCNTYEQMDAQPLVEEIWRVPLKQRSRIKTTNQHNTFRGLPVDGLVALYNAADVYWSTTGGEGFGLTLAEAAACGVPIVTNSWAAEAEVVGPGGVLIPPLRDSHGEVVRYHSIYGMDWALPDAKAAVPVLADLLTRPSRRRALGAAGRAHVTATFNWDQAAADFVRLFEDAHAAAVHNE